MLLNEEKIRKIEHDTRQQKSSSLWFEMRHYRLTVSLFGSVLQRRSDTPLDSLVLKTLQPKQFSSPATEWGKSVIIADMFNTSTVTDILV